MKTMMSDTENPRGPAPAKRPYRKPEFRFERVFETQALSCGKVQVRPGFLSQQSEELVSATPMIADLQQCTALQCELVADVARAFGEVRLRVTGASMLPAIWPGDILVTVQRQ